jgi:hypothetical protein
MVEGAEEIDRPGTRKGPLGRRGGGNPSPPWRAILISIPLFYARCASRDTFYI